MMTERREREDFFENYWKHIQQVQDGLRAGDLDEKTIERLKSDIFGFHDYVPALRFWVQPNLDTTLLRPRSLNFIETDFKQDSENPTNFLIDIETPQPPTIGQTGMNRAAVDGLQFIQGPSTTIQIATIADRTVWFKFTPGGLGSGARTYDVPILCITGYLPLATY